MVREPSCRPQRSHLALLATVFVGWIFLADAFAVAPMKAFWSNFERMEGFFLIVHLWFYGAMLGSLFINRQWWRRYIITSLIASALVVAFAGMQLIISDLAFPVSKPYATYIAPHLTMNITCYGSPATLAQCLQTHFTIEQGGNRLDSTIGNAIYLAVYVAVHFFLALFVLMDWRRAKWQNRTAKIWAFGGVSLLALSYLIVLWFTGTRATQIGFMAAWLVMGVGAAVWARKPEQKRLRYAGIAIVVAVVVLVGGFFALRKTAFVQNNLVLSRLAAVSLFETSSQARGFIWPMALRGSLENPVLGWGQEGFNYVFNSDYDPHMWRHEQWFDRAHNVFLDWLVAAGYPGFLLYIALYVMVFALVVRSHEPLQYKLLITGLLTVYTVSNMSVFDNLSSYLMFTMLIALAHSLYAHKTALMKKEMVFHEDVSVYVVAPIVALVLVVSLYMVNYKPYKASQTLVYAMTAASSPQYAATSLSLFDTALGYNTAYGQEIREQLVQTALRLFGAQEVAIEAKTAFANRTVQELEILTKELPRDARAFYFAGLFFESTGHAAEAAPFLERAVALSPKKQTLIMEYASALFANGQVQDALAKFKYAYELDTTNDDAKGAYALALVAAKKLPDFDTLVANGYPADERLASVLASMKDYTRLAKVYEVMIAQDARVNRPNIWTSLAATYVQLHQNDKAIALLTDMASRTPAIAPQIKTLIQQIRTGRQPAL
jgi:O-antigen ligase/tetratricopeptide (TPR) repeat protein